jgi:hypothetical protein
MGRLTHIRLFIDIVAPHSLSVIVCLQLDVLYIFYACIEHLEHGCSIIRLNKRVHKGTEMVVDWIMSNDIDSPPPLSPNFDSKNKTSGSYSGKQPPSPRDVEKGGGAAKQRAIEALSAYVLGFLKETFDFELSLGQRLLSELRAHYLYFFIFRYGYRLPPALTIKYYMHILLFALSAPLTLMLL